MLTRPLHGRVERAGDADAVRQPAFDRNQIRGEEGEPDRHVDVAFAAILVGGNFINAGDCRGSYFSPVSADSQDARLWNTPVRRRVACNCIASRTGAGEPIAFRHNVGKCPKCNPSIPGELTAYRANLHPIPRRSKAP